MSEDLAKTDRTKIDGQTNYPVEVLEQAKDENAITNIFASKYFDMFVKESLERSDCDFEKKDKKGNLSYMLMNQEAINRVLRNCFQLAEGMRQYCEVDLDTRLKVINKAFDEKGVEEGKKSMIVKPTAEMMRAHIHAGSVPGM